MEFQKQYKIDIDYDELPMVAYNLVSDLDNILKEYGIRLEIEDEEHDGYDVCIITVNKYDNE